jgi:hypothetical protein
MNNETLGLLIKYIIPDIEERILYKFENSGLTEREIFVLKRKWFDGLSFAEIGKSLTRPVSRERIRQIEAKAFRKLKHPSKRFWETVNTHDLGTLKENLTELLKTLESENDEREKDSDLDLDEKSTLRKIHLEELGLSGRSYAALRRAGIFYVGDLMDYSIEDLKGIRNLGKKSLAEITEKAEALPFFEFKRQVED